MKLIPIHFLLLPLVSAIDLPSPIPFWPIKINLLAYNPTNNNFLKVNIFNSRLYLNPNKNNILIIHGWHDNPQSPWISKLASTYHELGRNYRILAVDWSKFSQLNYLNAALISRLVGEVAGNLIGKQINKGRLNAEKLHVIGHGMGAQIAGFAGKKIKSQGFQLDRITALDSSLFAIVPNVLKLRRGDAAFVDFVHNDFGLAKIFQGIGNVDFYIDSPCNVSISADVISVNKSLIKKESSYHYYTQGLKQKISGVKCPNFLAYKMKLCGTERATFGEYVERNATGSYFVDYGTCNLLPKSTQSIMSIVKLDKLPLIRVSGDKGVV